MTEQFLNTQLAESLSALTDNEASELELARVLKVGNSDDAVNAQWSRYQVARAAMRGDLPSELAPEGFVANITAALADEPAPSSEHTDKRPALSRWWLGLGRAAIAASVTGAVVIGAQLYQGDTLPGTDTLAHDASKTPTSAPDNSLPIGYGAPALPAQQVSAQSGGYTPLRKSRQVVFEPRRADVKVSNEQIRAYLNQLVEEHTDHAAVNSTQGMLPYARVPLIEEE